MRIEKTECNYQVTECDLKFGEQITLDGELLIPISVLDKIRAEIMDTGAYEQEVNGYTEFLKGINYCLKIIDKYRIERENEL